MDDSVTQVLQFISGYWIFNKTYDTTYDETYDETYNTTSPIATVEVLLSSRGDLINLCKPEVNNTASPHSSVSIKCHIR